MIVYSINNRVILKCCRFFISHTGTGLMELQDLICTSFCSKKNPKLQTLASQPVA